jgi:hypothetical protein
VARCPQSRCDAWTVASRPECRRSPSHHASTPHAGRETERELPALILALMRQSRGVSLGMLGRKTTVSSCDHWALGQATKIGLTPVTRT